MLALSTANILGEFLPALTSFSRPTVDPRLLTEVVRGLSPPEGSCQPAEVEEFLVWTSFVTSFLKNPVDQLAPEGYLASYLNLSFSLWEFVVAERFSLVKH